MLVVKVVEFFSGEEAYTEACRDTGRAAVGFDIKRGRCMDFSTAAGAMRGS